MMNTSLKLELALAAFLAASSAGCDERIPGKRYDTLCDVVAGSQSEPANSATKTSRLTSNGINIYFDTDVSQLSQKAKSGLSDFLKKIPAGASFIDEGYADSRGSAEYNIALSQRRADSVAEAIKNVFPKARVMMAAYGEGKSNQSTSDAKLLAEDRKVRVITNQGIIARGLDMLPSDVYLIDESGSMLDSAGPSSKKTKWQEVQSYNFPDDAKVFTFTSYERPCGGPLSKEKPDRRGITPLFYEMIRLLERTESNKSITVLTDGADSNILGRFERVKRIKELAHQKHITVSFLGIGLDKNYEGRLRDISRTTGGNVYMITP